MKTRQPLSALQHKPLRQPRHRSSCARSRQPLPGPLAQSRRSCVTACCLQSSMRRNRTASAAARPEAHRARLSPSLAYFAPLSSNDPYKTGRVRGTRECVITENYLLVYRIRGNDVQILRVLRVDSGHRPRQKPRSESVTFCGMRNQVRRAFRGQKRYAHNLSPFGASEPHQTSGSRAK